ncbi:glycogen debranching protein [Kribbella capetownensis]|uniref:Glycogen debranching protein n=1 Tax=Kribbella capetownensis TaxID=1572659 RepID=A0A4R0JPA5_9ACTN|nr:glycogen debranching protein [Kribbella capetownensis]TCC49093.1 glycogen debranching protein [Kribbella capetownensis]
MTTTDSRPTLRFEDPESQALYGAIYPAALENLLVTNTVRFGDVHSRSGLMDPAVGMVRAGGGYEQPWTRDATINSWNATSLLAPALAANTLWAVVEKDAAGKLRVQQDSQQWDQVVWTVGAWHHYLVTGDRNFLQTAYDVVTNTLALREQAAVFGPDARYGLFTGPSFFNDGVSGFPAPTADEGESRGSESTSYPDVVSAMYLSTNALYYAAYSRAAEMADTLGRPADGHRAKAVAIRQAVNEHFWNPRTGSYNYQLTADGSPGAYQEGTGLAFALLFGIADGAQASALISNAHRMRWGMPDTYPQWDRYSSAEPGRHNAIVWPLVQGLWAKGLARHGEVEGFATETRLLAELVRDSGGFWEIYDGNSGAVEGGYQGATGVLKRRWDSEPDQTWSATAFIDMMHTGLFGMVFDDRGLTFAPALPSGWGDVTLSGLRYRDAGLTMTLRGAGKVIRSFELDGSPCGEFGIPASLHGDHTIEITLDT